MFKHETKEFVNLISQQDLLNLISKNVYQIRSGYKIIDETNTDYDLSLPLDLYKEDKENPVYSLWLKTGSHPFLYYVEDGDPYCIYKLSSKYKELPSVKIFDDDLNNLLKQSFDLNRLVIYKYLLPKKQGRGPIPRRYINKWGIFE
jgi:hypothetical protein